MKIEWVLERFEAMITKAKEIEAEQIERSKKYPETSTKEYAAGTVVGLELALKVLKEEMEDGK